MSPGQNLAGKTSFDYLGFLLTRTTGIFINAVVETAEL